MYGEAVLRMLRNSIVILSTVGDIECVSLVASLVAF